MRAPLASQRASASANMTPMIDVVFLLIIFFLVSSHLAKREVRMPLNLPIAQTHRIEESLGQRMTINVDTNGQVHVGGTVIKRERLPELLVDHVRQHSAGAAVRIRTDATVAYGDIEPLLREIAAIGIVDITFAVHEER